MLPAGRVFPGGHPPLFCLPDVCFSAAARYSACRTCVSLQSPSTVTPAGRVFPAAAGYCAHRTYVPCSRPLQTSLLETSIPSQSNLLAMTLPPVPEAFLTEDNFINGQPCPSGPIPECSYQAEPVKLRPATHALNAVSPLNRHAAQLITAKRFAPPACSITMVPEGLYDHQPGSASVYRVLGEHPLLLDAGSPVTRELVKPDVLEVSTNPPQHLHARGEPGGPWADLELDKTEFLKTDPMLKMEVPSAPGQCQDFRYPFNPGGWKLQPDTAQGLRERPSLGTRSKGEPAP